MDPPTKLKVAGYLFNTLCLLVPLLVCLPVIPKIKQMKPLNRYFLAIPLTWITLFLFNDSYYLGARLQHASYRGNHSYDGIALNVMIDLFGWLIPVITGIPMLIIAGIIRKRKTQSTV